MRGQHLVEIRIQRLGRRCDLVERPDCGIGLVPGKRVARGGCVQDLLGILRTDRYCAEKIGDRRFKVAYVGLVNHDVCLFRSVVASNLLLCDNYLSPGVDCQHCVITIFYRVTIMTPAQLRMARSALKIGIRELAEMADVTTATITRYENERGGLNAATSHKLKSALESAGVIFIEQNGNGPGVRLRDRS